MLALSKFLPKSINIPSESTFKQAQVQYSEYGNRYCVMVAQNNYNLTHCSDKKCGVSQLKLPQVLLGLVFFGLNNHFPGSWWWKCLACTTKRQLKKVVIAYSKGFEAEGIMRLQRFSAEWHQERFL